MSKITFCVIAIQLFAYFSNANRINDSKRTLGDLDWWKTAVFYQIYPPSFMDSNNDGVGDLQGIIQRLDHLVDIGVTAIWLSPIYKSPMKDFGYDVSDFRDIDPTFGTMDDFQELVQESKRRNLRVVLDYVPNHSSDEHEWFEKSAASEKGFEDYYVWHDGKNDENGERIPPNNWISHFHGPAWTFNTKRQQWYLHQYHSGQPDLNFRSAAVRKETKDILTFWLDLGVDGFRVDTVPSLVETADFPDEELSGNPGCTDNDYCYLKNLHQNDQPETYEIVYDWRQLLDDYIIQQGGDARIMMTESYSEIDKLILYYGDEERNGAHFSFNFFFMTNLNTASTAYDIDDVIKLWLNKLPAKYTSN